jgi:DNA-binding NtrC family response regulator
MAQPAPVVAIVEDDASCRTALARLLGADGFRTALFDSAEAYLDDVPVPTPLGLVLDVRLPGMSGFALLRQLRAAGDAPPVIVTSGVDRDMENAERHGAIGFLPKPIDSRKLLATLTSLADSYAAALPQGGVRPIAAPRTIAAESLAIRRMLDQVRQVGPTTATVLLLGETGVGKEVVAHAIHDASPRHRRAMVTISCAAMPSTLIESELFGRERGAFTGALARQIGRFEQANGSSILLDEIGDLPLDMQVKLLRVLQERTIERLGTNDTMKVDVRIIAATNRDLETAVVNGTFREDLFYRLNVFPIVVPPLRDRLDDIPGLVRAFVDEFAEAFGKRIETISRSSMTALRNYHWPGNIRELRNLVEREVIVATGPALTINVPQPVAPPRAAATSRLVDVERQHIRMILESCGWRIRGAGGAAERLGIKPTTLESRMLRLGIAREKLS